jgi:translation initiation factor 3 subunit F
MDATLLPIGSVNAGTVKIQPVVLLQICDAYIRRNEKQERVIGTLLGNTSPDGVVEVKSCYVVPHTESDDQVSREASGRPGRARKGGATLKIKRARRAEPSSVFRRCSRSEARSIDHAPRCSLLLPIRVRGRRLPARSFALSASSTEAVLLVSRQPNEKLTTRRQRRPPLEKNAAPHSQQVAVDVVHHKTMYDLHHKVAPTENIVGWFSTGPTISSSDALIQEFYAKELAGAPQQPLGASAAAPAAPATPAPGASSTGGTAPATSAAAAAAAAPATAAAAVAAGTPATAAAAVAAGAPPATPAAAASAPGAAATQLPAGPSPVHLTVDTSLTGDRVAVRAYVSRALLLGGRALATEFVPVPSRIDYLDLERVGADLMLSGGPSSSKAVATEHETLQTSVRRLQGLLAIARSYADDVAAGRRKGDPAIGRCLDDALAAAPALPAAEFEALVAQGVQDALLVDHLAHLVRAQMALAERLGTAALPLL